MWENLGFKIEGTGYVPLQLLGEKTVRKVLIFIHRIIIIIIIIIISTVKSIGDNQTISLTL